MEAAASSGDALPGIVTIMFTDVERSTELATGRGDEAARAALRGHEQIVRRRVGEHGGRELKAMGDGFMLAFASPRRAISCAVAIQRDIDGLGSCAAGEGVRLRIGLNCGEVVHENDDVFGEAVNAAARIAARAAGGEVLVSDVVRSLAGTLPGVTYVDRGRVRLRGFPDRWRLHAVDWGREARAGGGRPALVGREEERSRLVALLERARAGTGALVTVGGEPGIGKTRLVEEIAAEARRLGAVALIGRCHETDSTPYTPFVEIIEAALEFVPPEGIREALGDSGGEVARIVPGLLRRFPDLPAPLELPAEQERRYLLGRIRDFVERASRLRPLLIVIDDLHWADAATLLVIEHVAERLASMPTLILATYRDVDLDVGRPLAQCLDALIRRRLAERMSLRRLPREQTAALLTGLSGHRPPDAVVDAIVAETEGNPFFVEEIYRHLAAAGAVDPHGEWRAGASLDGLGVPQSLRLVIGRRLHGLQDVTRDVLALAAVAGRTVDQRLLTEAAGTDVDALLDALDEAERAQVLIAGGRGRDVTFTFAHELIRQTLLAEMSTPRRQRLHLRLAGAIERVAGEGSTERAAEIAHHLAEGGAAADPGRTVSYLRLAAHRALEASAYEEAVRHLQTALELAPDDRMLEAQLLEELGRAQRSAGRWSEGMRSWEQALEIHEARGDAVAAAHTCSDIAVELAWAGRQLEAGVIVGRGLAALSGRTDPTRDRARLLIVSGTSLSFAGDHEAGAAQGGEGERLARELEDAWVIGEALTWLAFHRWFWLEMRECIDSAGQAIPQLRATGNLWDLVGLQGGIASVALILCGDVAAGTAMAREAIELGRRLGNVGAEFGAGRALFFDAARRGDLDEAARLAARDRELAEATGWLWTFDTAVFGAVVDGWRGRWSEALAACRTAEEREIPCCFERGPWGMAMVAAAHLGDAGAVRALWESRRAEIPPPGAPAQMGTWTAMASAVDALWIAGDRDGAASLYPRMVEALSRGVVLLPYCAGLVQRVAGLAAAAGRDWNAAEEHCRAAVREADSLEHRIEAAAARRAYAQVLAARDGPGDAERAAALLGDSRARFRALGMERHAAA